MNIGFDASYAILKNNTTEGNYSKVVIDALAEAYPGSRLYAYTPDVENRTTAASLANRANVHIKQPRGTLSKALWLNVGGVVGLLRHHRVNVYHGLAGRLPLRLRRVHTGRVVTIHSLAYKRFPGDYSWWERVKRGFWTRRSCRLAHRVVATSRHTRDDLVELLGVPADKIDVVPPTVDTRFTAEVLDAELDTVRHKYKLPEGYILVVSSLLEHKNVLAVLKAMRRIADKEICLVLVGVSTDHYEKVLRRYAAKHRLMHRLLHVTRAHAADMPSIYRQARVLVAPSRHEGFGMTVLEAQACGLPVVATRGTSQEEAAGEGALYFDPDSPEELAAHLDRLLAEPALCRDLAEAGRRNLDRFDRRALAEQLMQIYRKSHS